MDLNKPQNDALVRASPASPEAFLHAPTLMAGSEPGTQGAVRIWMADRRAAWMPATLWTGLTVLCWTSLIREMLLGFSPPAGVLFSFLYITLFTLVAVYSTFVKGRRPPCFSTDEAGLGITLWRGSIPLRWTEIVSANLFLHQLSVYALTPAGYKCIVLDLQRFRRATRKELFRLIIDRAELAPSREVLTDDLLARLPFGSAQKRGLRLQRSLSFVTPYLCRGEKYLEILPRLQEASRRGAQYLSGPGDVSGHLVARYIMAIQKALLKWLARRDAKRALTAPHAAPALVEPSAEGASTLGPDPPQDGSLRDRK